MTRKHLLPFLIILFLLAACQSEKAAQIASTSDSGIAEYYAGEPSAGPAAEGDFAQNDSLGTVTNAAQTKYQPGDQYLSP